MSSSQPSLTDVTTLRSTIPVDDEKHGKIPKKDGKPKLNKTDEKTDEQKEKLVDWFIEHRMKVWETAMAKRKAETEAAKMTEKKICVELPNGSKVEAISGVTTPLDIAKKLSNSLAAKVVVATVNEIEWDVTRPLEGDCKLTLLDFESKEGSRTFWHSSAHILGQALEAEFPGARLCVGPPLNDGGFYYDVSMPARTTSGSNESGTHATPMLTAGPKESGTYATSMLTSSEVISLEGLTAGPKESGTYATSMLTAGPKESGTHATSMLTVRESNFKSLEKRIDNIIKQKQPFVRLLLTKEEALEMFKDNKFKQEIIKEKVPDGSRCTAYRCGTLIDLCKGPHVTDTGRIRAMAVTNNSSCYWKGDAKRDSLQRVYGISFPDKEKMKEYREMVAKAAEQDHRRIGAAQKLFFTHELSPGSAFFLPMGTRVYNTLINFMKEQYKKRGYSEVVTPNIFNVELWKTSGHYQNYKDNMFLFQCEDQEFAMKPMNCPGHCLIFGHELHSFRDLPLRLADFGVLHRNEISGALSGLTRVRRFQQDDGHIFCRPDQIEVEVAGVLDFLKFTYGVFGFDYTLQLSTRPEKDYLGDIKTWDAAESALKSCLDKFCKSVRKEWTLNPGDGAFYGPKIDIQLFDALKRKHQCATIQLDFQLPERFELAYKTSDGLFQRPVIIHRAILGSVERMMAVLIEHFGGKWPFWLSPRQVCVVPVSQGSIKYANEVYETLKAAGFHAEIDDSKKQLPNKVRECFVEQWNYIAVVGEKEEKSRSVTLTVRPEAGSETHIQRGRVTEGPNESGKHATSMLTMTVEEMIQLFSKLRDTHK